jgi:hypothetical protein
MGTSLLIGQEILTGLPINPVIKKQQANQPAFDFKSTYKFTPKSVELPFFEDFKQKDIYPDTSRWIDYYVYINTDFPYLPPTWGAATFDALNAVGNVYGNANPLQFKADQLTSRPIRLDSVFDPTAKALSPADSVYLSFYYQPQGRGNDPQSQDSLVLEFGYYSSDSTFWYVDSIEISVGVYISPEDTIFPGDVLYSPCNPNWGTTVSDTLYALDFVTLPCDSVYRSKTDWQWAWSSIGMTLDTFKLNLLNTDSGYFKQVMIPITDTALFRNDFQFRFFNYASIASDNLQSWQSNCDYWNVDFIYLNYGRTQQDTTYEYITFTDRAPSFLKEYESMPFTQYRDDPTNVIKGGFEMYISNMDDIQQTSNYFYSVDNDAGGNVYTYTGGSWSLEKFNEFGYITYPPFAAPPVEGIFPPFGNRDSAYFDITHYLVGDQALGLADTLSYRQKFYNYYAYDDGTAEFGYGLTPSGSQLAYQFTLSKRDTLRAIQMFFNKTLTGANEQFFYLTVWKDLNGEPGEIVYIKERQSPVFEDSLYKFHTYHLDSVLPVQGTFYVGWIQTTTHNLNVGFDSYNDASAHIFYNTSGVWDKSSYTGALMIRPVLGKKLVDDPVVKSGSIDYFLVSPNPSIDGQLWIKFMNQPKGETKAIEILPDDDITNNLEIEVYNIVGQRVFYAPYVPQINLSFLQPGVYLMRLNNTYSNNSMVQKLIISR